MQLGLSENLSALVGRRFTAAKEGGHLIFSSTYLSIITAAGIPVCCQASPSYPELPNRHNTLSNMANIQYQLRYCPALARKPSNLKPNASSDPDPPKPDPFETPSPDLLLASFPPQNPTHALVLNKFPVIPNHFILATKSWKAQTDLLEPVDLDSTYACLRAWDTSSSGSNAGHTSPSLSSNRLFAFFNSGDDSGASQPHRHLQFLPVEAMHQPGTDSWAPLIDLVTAQPHNPSSFQSHPALPFAHFALPLPLNPTPEALHEVYIKLYRAAVAASQGRDLLDSAALRTDGPAAISYNLAMTLSTMMIAPRRAETARVPVDVAAAGDVADPGVVSLNGTILAGTLMVKAEAEWDVLRAEPEILGRMLRDVGLPGIGHKL
ncbi:uncharacterized protein N7482_008936 [Penicillium canariense]|uniref:Bis(5'-nucleosyl)-tetraphosphatase n=1 Tax=Penicillium canariense TaxID=189055 RepID=A0A9W9HXJ6_9EURO|nr:uncharacterized protein N7482_008936 [Penicillium canariense]KAJ5157836.1 hypothetical protein N7482_008936 [Penicillium canariense]